MKLAKCAKRVFEAIEKECKGNGQAIIAVKKLMKLTGFSESAVRDATKKLYQAGVIEKKERRIPDHRTGEMKQVSNEYRILSSLDACKSGGGEGSKSGGEKILSFKTVKEKTKIKREEAAAGSTPSVVQPSENHTYENRQQITPQSIPTTAEQVKQAMAPIIDRFNPAVVQHVIALYAKLLPTGHIGSPLGWLRGALNKEQARFEKFGYSGMKKRSKSMTYTNFLKAGGFEPEETFWANLINRQPYQAF